MRKQFLVLFLVLAASPLVHADQYVRGYYTKDGTYVAAHYRSDPDGDKSNNWSEKGNINPHTGKKGYKN